MNDNEVAGAAAAHLFDGAIDQVGSSPRRWLILLTALLVGGLVATWLARRSVRGAPPLPEPPPELAGEH